MLYSLVMILITVG